MVTLFPHNRKSKNIQLENLVLLNGYILWTKEFSY
jgi:hypothetical protein